MKSYLTPVAASLKFPRLVSLLALAMVTAAIPIHAQTTMRPGQQGADRNSSATSARPESGYQNMDRDRIQSSNTDNRFDLSSSMLAEELRGRDVHNSQNEKIGSISDVVVDVDSGRAPYVIVRSGGLLGMGSTQRAVPTGALTRGAASGGNQGGFVLNTSKDIWDRAPALEHGRLGDLEDEVQGRNLHSVYGQQWTADNSSSDTDGPASHRTHGLNPSDRGRKNPGMDSDAGQSRNAPHSGNANNSANTSYSNSSAYSSNSNSSGSSPNSANASNANASNANASNANAGTSTNSNASNSASSGSAGSAGNSSIRDNDAQARSRLNTYPSGGGHQRVQKLVLASELKGKTLVSSTGERDLGRIEDIIIARDSSHAAILLNPVDNSGGNDQKYVVPFSRVNRRGEGDRYTADFDRSEFSGATGSGASDRASGEVRQWPSHDRSRTETGTQTNSQSRANGL